MLKVSLLFHFEQLISGTPYNSKIVHVLFPLLDMVPDFVNKFTSKGEKENVVEESEDDSVAKKTAAKEMEQILSDSVNKEE
jgi:hypothetical protein